MNRDLSRLKEKAIELGATGSKIIPTDMISIEDEIIELCRAPLCEGYGKSANCPPHVIKPEEARELIGNYQRGVLFKIDFQPELLLSKDRFKAFREIYEIASENEASSIKAGYTLSRGFAAGSCKPVFCNSIQCQALINGRSCRYPSLGRPSMEALGMNVFQLVRDVGWKIHPIGKDSDPKAIPEAMLVGLVLVA